MRTALTAGSTMGTEEDPNEFGSHGASGLAASAGESPPIGIDRVSRRILIAPAPRSTLRFGDVGPHPQGRQIDQRLIAVIPLVGDHSLDDRECLVDSVRRPSCSAASGTASWIVVVSP